MFQSLRVACFAVLATLITVGMSHAQLTLVPNGDFETPGGVDWDFAGVGATPSFPSTGGNGGGGYGQLDQTAGGWGGVLVSEVDPGTGHSLASLGVAAGMTATFSVDIIDLAGNDPIQVGMKVENWAGGSNIGDSGDVYFDISTSWETYTFDFLVDPAAEGLKFVPVFIVAPQGSSVGFDNVGVVSNVIPEPSTAILVALGLAGVVSRRRR